MPSYSRETGTTGQVYQPRANEEACIRQVITMATGDLDTNDTFDICRVPAGAKITDVKLVFTDMDTGGAPTLAFHVGDSGDTDRFISAGAATAAGTLEAGNNATSAANWAAHAGYTAETLIYGTCSTGAATAAAGTIVAHVRYVME